jgi:hypothetical protein
MSPEIVQPKYRVFLETPLASLMKQSGLSDVEYFTNDLDMACKLLNINDGRGQLFEDGNKRL